MTIFFDTLNVKKGCGLVDTGIAVANRLLALCGERDISIRKLAAISAIPPSTMKNILYGRSKNPGIVTIKKLCGGLEIALGEVSSTPEFDALEQEIKIKPRGLGASRTFAVFLSWKAHSPIPAPWRAEKESGAFAPLSRCKRSAEITGQQTGEGLAVAGLVMILLQKTTIYSTDSQQHIIYIVFF